MWNATGDKKKKSLSTQLGEKKSRAVKLIRDAEVRRGGDVAEKDL